MNRTQIRSTLNELKRGQSTSINGYTVKRVGINWRVEKGTHFRKTYADNEIDVVISRLVFVEDGRTSKQENKLAKRRIKNDRQELKRIRKNTKKRNRKRNSVAIETTNIIIQLAAIAVWALYFFPAGKFHLNFAGKYQLLVIIGMSVIGLISHIIYFKQLGRKHKIINILWGFISIAGIITASFFLKDVINNILNTNVIGESILVTIKNTAIMSIMGYLLIKLILSFVFISNKK